MENRTRVIFYCVRRWASFLVNDFIRSALLRAIDSRNTFPLAECCLQVYNINISVVVVVLIWGTFMAREFIISERKREKGRFPCDMADRFSLWLSGLCAARATWPMLRLSINVQDVSPFGNGQLLYIQRVKKKIENYNWFQKRPFVGGKKGGSIF